MTDISTVPTPDLVRELCSREGVVEITLNRNGIRFSAAMNTTRSPQFGLIFRLAIGP